MSDELAELRQKNLVLSQTLKNIQSITRARVHASGLMNVIDEIAESGLNEGASPATLERLRRAAEIEGLQADAHHLMKELTRIFGSPDADEKDVLASQLAKTNDLMQAAADGGLIDQAKADEAKKFLAANLQKPDERKTKAVKS